MFSISQIILIFLSFLLIGVSLYIFYSGKKQSVVNHYSLLRYFTPLLFVIFICSEITYLVYYSKFLYYFGVNAAILTAVSFAVLAIPVYGFMPKGILQSFGILNILKRRKITEPKAVPIPVEFKPEELKITEKPVEIPEEIQDESAVTAEQIPEIKPAESIEKIEIVHEEVTTTMAEPQVPVTEKAETKHVPADHKKAAVKKAVTKKPAVKKEVKKTEVKKADAKPVEEKHVKTVHSKARQTKAIAEKPKQTKQTKPRTKK